MDGFMRALVSVWTDSGFAALTWENCVMILVGLVLLYLSIAKEYEPLLLLPIAFGCIMANFPNTGFEDEMGVMMAIGFGIKYEIFPPLIFMGVGAMTDFGPLIANPKTMLLGAAAQIGAFHRQHVNRFDGSDDTERMAGRRRLRRFNFNRRNNRRRNDLGFACAAHNGQNP